MLIYNMCGWLLTSIFAVLLMIVSLMYELDLRILISWGCTLVRYLLVVVLCVFVLLVSVVSAVCIVFWIWFFFSRFLCPVCPGLFCI